MTKIRLMTAISLILLCVSLFLGVSFWKCVNTNRRLAEAIPYITTRETVDYFSLTGVDTSRRTIEDLNNSPQSLIFIFSRPCTPCNQNILFWNKLAQITGPNTKIYGIILTGLTDAYDFSQKTTLSFDIYTPDDPEIFKKVWRIRTDQAETILMRYRQPTFVQVGNLTVEDTKAIINRSKTKEHKRL